jgi:hypothetical protein
MRFALELGGASGRIVSTQTRCFGLDRSGNCNMQRALPITVRNLTSQGIRCAPRGPEENLFCGYGGQPLWLVNIYWLVLTDCSARSDVEFGKVSVRGAPNNLEML